MSDPAMVSKCIVGLLWGNEFPTWRQICPPKQSHNALWNHLDPVSRNLKVVRCTATICGVLRGRGGVHWGSCARPYILKYKEFLSSLFISLFLYNFFSLSCKVGKIPDL